MSCTVSAFEPPIPDHATLTYWGRLYADAAALAMAGLVTEQGGLHVLVTPDNPTADRLDAALRFFAGDRDWSVLQLPDWETLPYDVFSPYQDIISQRLETLYRLPQLSHAVLVAPVATVMQRLPPRRFLDATVFLLKVGDTLDPEAMRERLETAGYRRVGQVMEHGEYAARGSLLDVFPMGAKAPVRIDLFDNEVESIRVFDPETQRSNDRIEQLRILPGREFPLDDAAIVRFRKAFRDGFGGDPNRSLIYKDVSNGIAPGGLEYYLPLFFERTETLFDYLPEQVNLIAVAGVEDAAQAFWDQAGQRYALRRADVERPALPPERLFLDPQALTEWQSGLARIELSGFEQLQSRTDGGVVNFATGQPPLLRIQARAADPLERLKAFLTGYGGRVLFVAESAGRREALLGLLHDNGIRVTAAPTWQAFLASTDALMITVAPLEAGVLLERPAIAVIVENQLFGEQVRQARRRKRKSKRDPDALVRDLTELQPGAPVVHEDHGVGRYQGLQRLDVGGVQTEFLTLMYAGGDKLYVPVAALHLISRYTGADFEHAPLHKLGSEQWQRAKKKAAQKIRDVAAELLALYAQREAKPGAALVVDAAEYAGFAGEFPFEETPDQAAAIDAVLSDLRAAKAMDRVVCGDVGFGKTEVAMRAAFAVAQSGGQVALLVPTTLLAQQHVQNFQDRFAQWPIRIESLSRFRAKKQVEAVLEQLADGQVDIVIGTHKLLQPDVRFKNLRLVIVDEEQRFGVRQKERLKALRAEVDLLTLTATPIPRTLNMSLSGLRDLSIIATPPAHRHAIKTFVAEWNNALLQEAVLRELKRGGQVYFLHNKVENIEQIARDVAALIPEARVDIAHGQMRESELERVMGDFYHRRFNVLVATTIIESGIDVPNANTVIINRADRLGLAQLHQIRGRVGRSHHRAYAYLIAPPRKAMTVDAVKRLEAIEAMEDLGAGFTLATHDLEIRGAGDLLGEGQSGQIQEIGFGLYMDLLNRTVAALKSGRQPELAQSGRHGPEVDLRIPALLPDDYVPDVHTRLIQYKRLASATDSDELRELEVAMIDRFGLLPDAAKNLIAVTELKLRAAPLGIQKIDAWAGGGRIRFGPQPQIDTQALVSLVQQEAGRFKLNGTETLKFQLDTESIRQRIESVNTLLDRLTPAALPLAEAG